MSRLSITVIFFVFLFAFSQAQTPLDLPEDDVASQDPSITLTEPGSKTSILLPSEKPESEPATVAEWESESETKAVQATEEMQEVETNTMEVTRPITFLHFHPINRRFPNRSFPFRRHHRCRHHHHHRYPREIPYGNDMILSDNFDGQQHQRPREIPFGNDETVADKFDGHHRPREIPYGNDAILSDKYEDIPRETLQRRMRFHVRGGPRFPFRNENGMVKRPFRHMEGEEEREEGGFRKQFRHHHHHHHHDEEEEMRDHEEERDGGSLMMRFRKFLNRF